MIAEALARNDRYLREFVEAYDLCPFARRCRETGGLERRVLIDDPADIVAARNIVLELSTPAFNHIEVGLLIFAAAKPSFDGFDHFVAHLRTSIRPDQAVFHMVPFHPDSPADTADPHRFVSFLRRTPDPTIQLVRAELLDRIRGPDTEDTRWVDPDTLDHGALPPGPTPSMSTRIAEKNYATLGRIGVSTLRSVLDNIRRPG